MVTTELARAINRSIQEVFPYISNFQIGANFDNLKYHARKPGTSDGDIIQEEQIEGRKNNE